MHIFKKQIGLVAVIISVITLVVSASALAHVVVKPSEVLTGAFQTFNISVPNEKDNPTVAVKLIVPRGLQYVSPTVKPGWTISVEKDGEGEAAVVKSITWTDGVIPSGQRDDFTFGAKAPDNQTELKWKAYQTYQNGTTIAWDQDPATTKDDDDAPTGPFSVTKVVKTANSTTPTTVKTSSDSSAYSLAVIALVIAIIAFAVSTRRSSTHKK